LQNNNEKEKNEKLYEDTIDLYEKKKQFSLLVTLFLKIYENKDLCNKLIEIFYRVNEEENTDKVIDLRKEVKSFNNIYSNARDILEENNYNPIYFYGVLFCYLHFYDKANFPKMIEEFSQGNSDTLYEILIQYNSHFINPLKQSQEFYNRFVKYALRKEMDLKNFKIILNYVEDIETFLLVINSNIKEIFQSYEELKTNPIKISSNLKLVKKKIENLKKVVKEEKEEKKIIKEDSDEEGDISDEDDRKALDIDKIENECSNIIKLTKDIIAFSHKEKFLALYLRSTFWINLINEYNIPDWENINNIFNLRKLYKEYSKLVNTIYEDEAKDSNKKKKDSKNSDAIKIDIIRYLERDEFAFMLNKLIRDFFEANKNKLTNAEILGTIETYNPYFSIRNKEDKEKYKYNRDVYIFDDVNFSKITDVFIINFRNFNFEEMFEENITDYINKITSKIENIQTFGNIIKLINEKKIKEENQKDYFRI
jgi:hypothetical protein